MFNPERLLGSLLGKPSSSLLAQAGRGVGVPGKAGVLALLGGVAFAAFEHYSQQKARQTGAQPPPPAPPSPPPGPISSGSGANIPPPPPMSAPPAPPIAAPAPDPAKTALLLVRAMIAAAKADGVIDEEERRRIFERLTETSEEERDFVQAEIDKPLSLDELLTDVDLDPALAVEIYTASLLAIELDTSAEVNYLKMLARRLGLDEATVNRIHDQLGVIRIFA